MRWFYVCLLAITAPSAVAWQNDFEQQPLLQNEQPPIRNANHLFNAINSAMRQWGSSWFHNGMSFFLATIPANTQFYHGTHHPTPVEGMEWLAFEPEHANMFAHFFAIAPPNNRTAPQMPPGPQRPEHFLNVSKTSIELKAEAQVTLSNISANDLQPVIIPGWLHTYRTKHDLNLVYIDGLSAGKTIRGTMDSQDFILYDGPNGFMRDDLALAKNFCDRAKEQWHERIDGFIRMEAGFEIILCDFQKHLDVVDVHRPYELRLNKPGSFASTQFRFFCAIASRYHNIGGDRVVLNYDNFVSAYTHDIDLWHGDDMPRLTEATFSQLEAIRKQINEMVPSQSKNSEDSPHLHDQQPRTFDWQSISDLIVARYANPLQFLTYPNYASNATIFHAELKQILAPFIFNHYHQPGHDNETLNTERSIALCTAQFIPPSQLWNTSLGGRVVHSVADRICSTLIRISFENTSLSNAVHRIHDLRTWLDWSVWHDCGPCMADEVCVIPIWPLTTLAADRERPACKNETMFTKSLRHGWAEDYWIDPNEVLGPGLPLEPAPNSTATARVG